jgi:hypothetical protein
MSVQETNGYLDVENATLRAPRLEAVSNIGIANTAPQHAFSVGSNLYVDTESSNVLTVDGNVVCEGVKVGLIEIIPSYDLAAVSNVGNVTQSTIQFSNATTGFVTTANIEVGTANLFVDTTTSRVGVNMATPDASLHVTGNAYVSSNLEVGTANLFVDTVSGRVGIGTTEPVSGLTVFRDIESSNSFITERVLFRETWPNGRNSLVGDLGTWVVTDLNQQSNPGVETTPDGYGIVAFNGTGATNGEFVSPAFDLSDYAIVDGVDQADGKRKTTTRVFMKFWLGTRQLDANGEVVQVQFSPDNGSTWYTVATSQDKTDLHRFTMVSADLSPYILETSTQAKIRFYLPWSIVAGDYMRIGRIWIHESDVPTNLGGMWLGAGGNIGIGTTTPTARLDVRGDGMIFDKAKDDGTILTGLFNYTETQQAIDAGVDGGDTRGTITASTDIAPPPGTAGDVIAKFVNAYTSEAVTRIWYPGEIPIAVGTVIYFGVWAYATQNVSMEFFRFHDTGAQSVNFTYTTPNKWVWFEKTITSNRSYNFSNFRFDNNSAGRTVYLTGLTIRVGQSQNTGLPFTRRFCPQDNTGSVTAVRNLIAKEVNAREITSPDINVQYPGGIKFQRSDGDGFGTAHQIFVDSGKTISIAGSGAGGVHSYRLNSSSTEFAKISRVEGFYHRTAYNNGEVAKFIRHSGIHTSAVHILALYSNAPETEVENLDDEALKANWSTVGNYVQAGSYAGKPSGTTWAETSDERIKTDIEDADLELCAENVRNIPFRRYRLRDEYIKTHEANDRTKLGWIAQEVQRTFPKAVITDEGEKYGLSNVMSLDSDQLFKTAYGAVKYLLNEVTTLKERITVLENNT